MELFHTDTDYLLHPNFGVFPSDGIPDRPCWG